MEVKFLAFYKNTENTESKELTFKRKDIVRYILLIFTLFLFLPVKAQNTTSPQTESTTLKKERTKEDSELLEAVKKSGQETLDKGKDVVEHVQQEVEDTRSLRSHYSHNLFGNLSLIDTWLPFKWGISYAYNSSAFSTWELEYLKSSYAPFGVKELGEFTDQRISFFYRSFSQRNSFNFLYGLYYNSFRLSIGDKLLSNVTGGVVPGYDLLTVETLGVSWGFGNRWHLGRLLLSFDWLTINIPLIVLESDAPFLNVNGSETDKNDVRDVLDTIEKIPTFAIIKFQLGYSF
ncbi:MAG: hypothetical protein KDD34_04345 [Bdellovibrionales bacterium]|nr:hypothetical protein [Bdellovibrionales bacterium]